MSTIDAFLFFFNSFRNVSKRSYIRGGDTWIDLVSIYDTAGRAGKISDDREGRVERVNSKFSESKNVLQ